MWLEVGILLFFLSQKRNIFLIKVLSNKAKSTIIRIRIINPECAYEKTLKC